MRNPSINRREAIELIALTGVSALGVGCKLSTTGPAGSPDGRLRVQPRQPAASLEPGLHALGLGKGGRDGLLFVPFSNAPVNAMPLAVLFHGAGQDAHELINALRTYAETVDLVLLAPDSRGPTWDFALGGYGPDVGFIDLCLAHAFDHVNIDAARLRLCGFSDGASYALSLGLINGDAFERVTAFSPGFIGPGEPHGQPEFFITHGTDDRILPAANTRSVIVPELRNSGYEVEYHEFAGGHGVPSALLRTAAEWMANG